MEKVSNVDPFSAVLDAPKALLSDGGDTTVMLAVEVLPVPALVEVTCTLLFFTPAGVPCTFRETVHEPPPAIVPPERLAEVAPAVAVAVPPQVLLRFGVEPTVNPLGILSVNATPVSEKLG